MHSLKLSFILVVQIINLYTSQAKPNKVTVIMPTECENKNFCSYYDNSYPAEKIRKILQNYNVTVIDPAKVQNRNGNEQSNQPCESDTETKPIYYIADEEDNVRYVVQGIQNFTIVQCRDPGPLKPCKPFPDKQEICQYDIRCVEKLVPVQFLVLSHDGEDVEIAKIKDGLPMACSCEYNPSPRPFDECKENIEYFEYEDDLPGATY